MKEGDCLRNDLINRMCDDQSCCRRCPIGLAAHRLSLDCRQYIEIFPEPATKLAQAWENKRG